MNNKDYQQFLMKILNNHTGDDFDWIKKGSYTKKFIFPPKINTELSAFENGLIEIIPEKLKEALDTQENLIKLRKKRINLILRNISREHRWFYLQIEAYFFSEYFMISSWVRYWLSLWEKITNKNIFPKTNRGYRITDLEIQKAREYPIELLYDGKLRKSGTRFNGLCPFHQEKTPSFVIFPKNNWFCFGACNTGSDSINFYMKLKNVGFVEAVRSLNNGRYR